MSFKIISRIAGIVLLTAGLAGCIDMTMDVNVTSDTTAKATITQTMAADIYSMVKAADAQPSEGSKPFCKEEGNTLVENADGSATCTIVTEGAFADLKFNDQDGKPAFTTVSPGVVRVALATKGMAGELGSAEQDEQTKAMMKQFFDGHFLTIRFSGKEVTDTNLTLSADKTSAEIVIPFLDLMNGTAKLPEELYAVVRTN